MRNHRFLLLWTLLLVCVLMAGGVSVSSAQEAKTLIIRPRTGEYAGKQFYTNSRALVIGVRQYEFLPKDKWLDYPDRDAADLRDMLIRSYGFLPENVTVLIDAQATKANIEAELSALADDQKVKPDDRILVFFSGHGQTVKLTNGGEMGFLIPYDANVDLAHPENSGPYLASCLPMDHIWSYLEASPAKHALLLADACFGGLLAKGRRLEEKASPAVIAGLLTKPARQVLTAGGREEEVFEDPKWGHGAFTYKLLEELKARAAVPDEVFMASELASEVKIAVGNLTNDKQTPQFGSHDTEGEFLFISTEPRAVPPLNVIPHPLPPVALTKINAKDGAEMIWIPAGDFVMGSTEAEVNALLKTNTSFTRDLFSNAIPQRKVYLDGYYIYKNDVTVAMYKQFCQETGRKMPPEPEYPAGNHFNPNWSKEDHPIVNVSWEDAKAYCDWAGVSLPTEAQWEKAARGTDGREYPWGNVFDGSRLQHSASVLGDAGGTVPVGSFPSGASPFGVLDMAGNVGQWCSDWYDANYYQNAPLRNPGGPKSSPEGRRVVRGGSWLDLIPYLFRAADRDRIGPAYRDTNLGFRCASGL